MTNSCGREVLSQLVEIGSFTKRKVVYMERAINRVAKLFIVLNHISKLVMSDMEVSWDTLNLYKSLESASVLAFEFLFNTLVEILSGRHLFTPAFD